MSKFFQNIIDNNLFINWAATLDWLVNDNKFDETKGWTSGYIGSLTKKIKRMDGFSEGKTYSHSAIKSLEFPLNRPTTIVALFSNGNSECKDFIRHIRNGIAHGNTQCFKTKGELYIEIKDYDSTGTKQTAYFYFPMYYITQTHKLYTDVMHSFEKKRKRGGK
ncbi:MAG: hypothetical protein IKW59_04345 [Clostridia bacterium]|nr:hypothetical protein [Clostridia bacterium]